MKLDMAPAVNLGAAGLGNYFLTKRAAQDPSLRMPAWKPKAGEEPSVYSDVRFLGGILGVGLATFGESFGGTAGKVASRGGEIAAQATLQSLIATETIRKVAQEGNAAAGLPAGSPRGVYRISADEAAQAVGYAPQGAYGYR